MSLSVPRMMKMSDDQRHKIIKLLETAKALSDDLQESTLAFLIERALDEARAGAFPLRGQAPYFPG
jgi:hypothetical protein